LVEAHVARIHLNKNIADTAERAAENIRTVKEGPEDFFGSAFRIDSESC
jgi:hypothetical protein